MRLFTYMNHPVLQLPCLWPPCLQWYNFFTYVCYLLPLLYLRSCDFHNLFIKSFKFFPTSGPFHLAFIWNTLPHFIKDFSQMHLSQKWFCRSFYLSLSLTIILYPLTVEITHSIIKTGVVNSFVYFIRKYL